MTGSGIVGAGAVLVASTFWGSNFVVTKNYDMGDGMHFQFLMCTGVLLVGFFSLCWAERAEDGKDFDKFPLPDFHATISTEGLLGGFIWAIGNLLTVPIVNRIGVGLGLSIWAGFGTVLSFVLSRFHIFGLEPQKLDPEAIGYLGALFGVLSLAVFSKVKAGTPGTRVEGESNGLEERLMSNDNEQSEDELNRNENLGTVQVSDPLENAKQELEGVLMALFAGTMYGLMFLPLSIHGNQYPTPEGVSDVTQAIRFFFSQFTGIYLTSVVAFTMYILTRKNQPFLVPREAVLPSIISGVMWGIACMGSMIAVSELGLGVGYPLTTNGAFLVNASWSIFYFGEVSGRRNLAIFAVAGVLNLTSCLFLAIARS